MAPKSSALLAGALVLLSVSAAMCTLGFDSDKELGAGHEQGGLGELLNGLTSGANGFGAGLGKLLGGMGSIGGGLGGASSGSSSTGGSGSSSSGSGVSLGGFGGLGGGASSSEGASGSGGLGNGKGAELFEKKLAEKEAAKEGLLGTKSPGELIKLLLNPLELIGKIAAFFKLEKFGLVEAVGKGATFGLEVALQPALLSIKIIEKVFVPDSCRLKFMCELGKPLQVLKGGFPKFSPGFLDGASTLKAFGDGSLGRECEHLYPCGGELKLKKEFELLKNPLGNKLGEVKGGSLHEAFNQGGEHQSEHFGGDHNYAASNQRPLAVRRNAQ